MDQVSSQKLKDLPDLRAFLPDTVWDDIQEAILRPGYSWVHWRNLHRILRDCPGSTLVDKCRAISQPDIPYSNDSLWSRGVGTHNVSI